MIIIPTMRGVLAASRKFSPASFSSLRRWFKADAITVSNGAKIPTWKDSAGYVDLGQPTTANQPTFRTNQLNGLPLVEIRSSSAGQFIGLRGNQDGLPHGSEARTIYMLVRVVNGTRSSLIFWGNNATDNRCWNLEYNSNLTGSMAIVTASSGQGYVRTSAPPNMNGAFALMGVTYAAGGMLSSTKFYMNGVEYTGSIAAGTDAVPDTQVVTDNFIIGAGAAAWADMDVAEVVVCAEALSTTNRQKLEGYLAHRWGLASVLATGHPYKAAPPQ